MQYIIIKQVFKAISTLQRYWKENNAMKKLQQLILTTFLGKLEANILLRVLLKCRNFKTALLLHLFLIISYS